MLQNQRVVVLVQEGIEIRVCVAEKDVAGAGRKLLTRSMEGDESRRG